MTAPLSLREYFATAASGFTKADADVIGPQLEVMAEQGDVTERAIVDTARSSNSPLNRYFEWNDEVAADRFRLHQAGTMMRAIRIRVLEDNRPRVMPAYKIVRPQQKSALNHGHNVLHGESAAAVQKAKDAFEELTRWRARYGAYVVVWKDFARTFGGVMNQIGEAEDVVQAAIEVHGHIGQGKRHVPRENIPSGSDLDDATDGALTDMAGIVEICLAWREKHGPNADRWASLAEQAGFMIEAIDEATTVFSGNQVARERPCLNCGRTFPSAGIGNRLCERCATKTSVGGARL